MSDFESRLDAIRKWEPHVHALVEWDERAARRRAASASGGPLAGWAVGVKDIIDVAGLPTRCNAPFLPAEPAAKNAPIIDMLQSLGAFVISKTVTTTCAYFDPGPTRNPWNVAHTPGGSSSGSAAAVAAGMVRLALGTQTVGSINRPASFCGVTGFKPTYGRFPKEGIFPLAPSLDTVGYLTANAGDAQTAFAALSGEPPAQFPARLRIGLIEGLPCPPPDADMLAALRDAAGTIARAGHEVRPLELPSEAAAAFEDHIDLLAHETAHAHEELFAKYGASYTVRLRQLIERGRTISPARAQEVERRRQALIEQLKGLYSSSDVLLTASAPGAAPAGMATGDPRMNQLWTYVGYPSLTLPAALASNGLPLGIQLIAPRMPDADLLAAGAVVEKILGFANRPRLPPAPR